MSVVCGALTCSKLSFPTKFGCTDPSGGCGGEWLHGKDCAIFFRSSPLYAFVFSVPSFVQAALLATVFPNYVQAAQPLEGGRYCVIWPESGLLRAGGEDFVIDPYSQGAIYSMAEVSR